MSGAPGSQIVSNIPGMPASVSQHSQFAGYDREDSPMVDRPSDPPPLDDETTQTTAGPPLSNLREQHTPNQSLRSHDRNSANSANTQETWNSEDEDMSDDIDDEDDDDDGLSQVLQIPDVAEPLSSPIPTQDSNAAAPPPPQTTTQPPIEEQSQWMPIVEDTSLPSNEELSWIEARGEHSALDSDYWTARTFTDLRDSEYELQASGRIDWTISKFNGTKEDPQKELIMRSDYVDIGGHRWRIKLYPKGNETLYLGVYLECETFDKDKSNAETAEASSPPLQTPIPIVGKAPVDEPRVPAQFSIIAYNPKEPRVHYHKTTTHAFRRAAPDRGFSRFGHLHIYDLGRRLPEHRLPLLQNDTLAFIVHLRTFKDPTNCLFEPSSPDDDPSHSFTKTGLNGLSRGASPAYSDHTIVAAVSAWCLLPPFRRIIYNAEIPDRIANWDRKPKPLLEAFHEVLYSIRNGDTRQAVSLRKIEFALNWHGTQIPDEECDVFLTWSVIVDVLEKELQGTKQSGALRNLFGLQGFRRLLSAKPFVNNSDKIEVRSSNRLEPPDEKSSLCAGFAGSQNNETPPKILQIEIPRRIYDERSREWKAVNNRVQMGNTLDYNTTSSSGSVTYTLYGMISHKGNHQHGNYAAVLRPDGTRWYTFLDAIGGNGVLRLTHRQATRNVESSVYIAIYVRQDVADTDLLRGSPIYQKPPESTLVKPRFLDHIKANESEAQERSEFSVNEPITTPVEAIVLRSEVFLSHHDRGYIDVFNQKFMKANAKWISKILLEDTESLRHLRRQIMQTYDDIRDPDQIVLSYLKTPSQSELNPSMIPVNHLDDAKLKEHFLKYGYPKWFWAHVIPFEELQQYKDSYKTSREMEQSHMSRGPATAEVDVVMSDTENDPQEPGNEEANRGQAQATITNPSEPLSPGLVGGGDIVALPDAQFPGGLASSGQGTTGGQAASPSNADDWSRISDAQAWSDFSTHHDAIAHFHPFQNRLMCFFLKFFDPTSQTFLSLGAHLTEEPEVIEKTILAKAGSMLDTVLERPSLASLASAKSKRKLRYWQERTTSSTFDLQHDSTFMHNGLEDGCLIIVSPVLNEEESRAIERAGGLPTPLGQLKYLCKMANHPSKVAVCKTRIKDNFSSEYYKGAVAKGYLHGHGRLIFHNGDVFDGSFIMGRREGKGRVTYQNGDVYDGDWLDDQPHGQGTLVKANTGNSYTGGFKGGKQHGEGVTSWKRAEDGAKLCMVCYEKDMDCAFYDCGHVCCCIGCGRQIETCPVCRRSVMKAMKLYFWT